jgi:hypothetical protein
MFCENCGANLPDNAKFCDLCREPTGRRKNITKTFQIGAVGLLMVAFCVGIVGYAAGKRLGSHEPTTSTTTGDIVHFGSYDWRVLAVEDGKALLITEDCLPVYRPYHNEWVDITWGDCDLRNWLNNEFFNSFGPDKVRIVRTHLQTQINSPHDGTEGAVETDDYIFCLSVNEARKYFKDDADRAARYRVNLAWWWLRSPGYSQIYASIVNDDGVVNTSGYGVDHDSVAVRPALWLNLS